MQLTDNRESCKVQLATAQNTRPQLFQTHRVHIKATKNGNINKSYNQSDLSSKSWSTNEVKTFFKTCKKRKKKDWKFKGELRSGIRRMGGGFHDATRQTCDWPTAGWTSQWRYVGEDVLATAARQTHVCHTFLSGRVGVSKGRGAFLVLQP